jgi:AhpD family alkylhydroperoxidase
MEAWNRFISLNEREGAISPRRKELIAVALSVYSKCDMSIARYVKKALRLGARRDEIIEAAWIAVLMGGDPVLMHLQHVLKALEEFSEVEEEELIQLAQAQLAIDSEYKKLYYRLLDYVKCICNQTETVCRGGAARRRLAINIAEADGSVLRRIVAQECERRGWKEPHIVSSPTG